LYIAKESRGSIIFGLLFLLSVWKICKAPEHWWWWLTALVTLYVAVKTYRGLRRLRTNIVYLGWRFKKQVCEITGQKPPTLQEHAQQVRRNLEQEPHPVSYETLDEINARLDEEADKRESC
jgi:hypothetical protein